MCAHPDWYVTMTFSQITVQSIFIPLLVRARISMLKIAVLLEVFKSTPQSYYGVCSKYAVILSLYSHLC